MTSAPQSLADDQSHREVRYLIQMGVRVVCFLLAVLLWRHVPVWVSIVFIVGAVVLPYTAVLFANAGRERVESGTTMPGPALTAAPGARSTAPDATPSAPSATPGAPDAAPPSATGDQAPVTPDQPRDLAEEAR